jgi:hypothetical protein
LALGSHQFNALCLCVKTVSILKAPKIFNQKTPENPGRTLFSSGGLIFHIFLRNPSLFNVWSEKSLHFLFKGHVLCRSLVVGCGSHLNILHSLHSSRHLEKEKKRGQPIASLSPVTSKPAVRVESKPATLRREFISGFLIQARAFLFLAEAGWALHCR